MTSPSELASPSGGDESSKVRAGKGRGGAPEWMAERVVRMIGVVPGALGRGLDRLARVGWLKPVMAVVSSVWVGIATLLLIGIYVAIGSGFSSLRAGMEMTDLEFFDWWPMRVLLVMLAVTLTVVTLRRIPLTLYKLGVWTVHIGIMVLLAGSVCYFSQKNEGMVRIYLHKTAGDYYDGTERALYVYKMNADGTGEEASMTPLEGLPIYYEHLAEKGNGLDRELPKGVLAGVSPALKDARVKVVGYYPAAEMRQTGWRVAGAKEAGAGPGIEFQFDSVKGGSGGLWLLADSPAHRVLEREEIPFGLEYLRHPTAERLRDLEASFSGPMGITVRIPKLKIERTYSATKGQPIVVVGSPYTLIPGDADRMPMLSPGYQGAFSTGLMVKVARKDEAAPGGVFEFERMSMFRYPELSADFVKGERQKGGKAGWVDHDIEIVFHDGALPQFWIVEDEAGKLSLISRVEGKSTTVGFGADGKAAMNVPSLPKMDLEILRREGNVAAEMAPVIIPAEQRPRAQTSMDAMQLSMVELQVSVGENRLEHVYVPFVQFAHAGDSPFKREPTVVEIPGAGRVGFLLSTTRRALPVDVKVADFKAVKYSGAMDTYEDFVSTLEFTGKDGGQETQVAHLNNPAISHGLCFFQAMWDGDDNATPEKRFTVLGVGNRPGLMTMTVGAILMFVGIGYAFYVKPILLRAKKKSLAKWSQRVSESVS